MCLLALRGSGRFIQKWLHRSGALALVAGCPPAYEQALFPGAAIASFGAPMPAVLVMIRCRDVFLPRTCTMTSDPAASGEVTRLLDLVHAGDRGAVDRLFPLVYEELRRLARGQVHRSYSAPTLNATGLVHEAYLKLAGGSPVRAESRTHFLAIAGRAMRQVLVDRARLRGAKKRGGEWAPTTLMDGHRALDVDFTEMLALNEAIDALDPRQRQIVEARFFAGLEEAEIADLLGVSERTVRREWVKARAWLVRAMSPQPGPGSVSF
jgi:RNA polymerase sigma factor (TIGR02999 family)